MKIVNVDSVALFDNPHGVEAKIIYDSEDCKTVFMVLKPKQALKLHTTPVDVFFFILEGSGNVVVGEEKQEVTKNMLIESPKDIPHLLENTGIGFFKVLVVQLPKTK
jgi:mannose-6-phosphate isomerase-like protein (cupin superfamily)